MNISLKLDDASWTSWMGQLRNALAGSNTLLKKALLIVWPREAASHWDQEMGWDGPWAPWKDSTRRQRIAHEIRTTTAKQRVHARSSMVREGGALLVVSGRLRTQTMQEPIMRELPGGVEIVSPTPYSGFLDEGTENMAARPFMWLGDDAQENMAKIFLDGLEKQTGGTD